jgi:hypothetical protein
MLIASLAEEPIALGMEIQDLMPFNDQIFQGIMPLTADAPDILPIGNNNEDFIDFPNFVDQDFQEAVPYGDMLAIEDGTILDDSSAVLFPVIERKNHRKISVEETRKLFNFHSAPPASSSCSKCESNNNFFYFLDEVMNYTGMDWYKFLKPIVP